METKMKKYHMEKVKFKIGLLNGLIVPSVGRNGGLAMLWSRDIKVEVQGYSGNYIDAIVTDPESGFKWRITGFYGNPETHRRKESWDLLRSLSQKYQLPWLCFGDFNEIVSVEEKFGGGGKGLKGRWMNLKKQYTNVSSRILVTMVLILLGVLCKRVKAECT